MSIIVCNCQHCDEQKFQTLSCVHYTIFSVVKLDLFIRATVLDRNLALEKTTSTPRVHLVNGNISSYAKITVSQQTNLFQNSFFLYFFLLFFEKNTYCCRTQRLSVRLSVRPSVRLSVCVNNLFSQ